MKYVAVTPQYKKENEELKQTGSDSTLELPTDPHTQPHSLFLLYYVGLVLCVSVVLVSFGTFYRIIYL